MDDVTRACPLPAPIDPVLLRLVVWTSLVAALALAGCGHTRNAADAPLGRRTMPVEVGASTVDVAVTRGAGAGWTLINLHDDEDTAVAAAEAVLRERGGRLVEVRHTGARNVSFQLDGHTYAFDPNRIFTDEGAAASLRDQSEIPAGEEVAPQAVAATRAFARRLLDAAGFDTLRVVLTVHNNTEGNYSAESYAEGGTYEREARSVYLAPEGDPDDFFFVTDERLFDRLRGGAYGVVLQDNRAMTDDGSLSVHSGQRGVPYVNVEAQHGHRAAQVVMLRRLLDVLEAGW